ncbi:MAG: hypothetical protein IJW55_09985 [Clostridia bacterium]|nr:hypothetical protein [Clostridia bacterium]MBQ7348276.1 hypothetical protein [Clostridia bacterium]
MKKFLSILLVCAMLLSFGITATATETETTKTNDTVIEQIGRIDIASLADGKDENNVYSGILYPQTETSDYTGTLKIAHDGDYLYLVSWANNIYANRKSFEAHIYIELDDSTKYQIVGGLNYGPYTYLKDGTTKTNVNYYNGSTTASRYENGYEFYYRFGVFTEDMTDGVYPTSSAVNAENALDYGIFCGLNHPGTTSDAPWEEDGAGYEIVIPMPESIRSALGNGENVNVKIGFTYMHKATADLYTTTGGAAPDETTDYRAWANSGSTNALVNVTLQGKAQSDAAEIADTEIVGVQTTEIGEEGTTYSARFVATLNTPDLQNAKIGFRLIGTNTVDKQCNTVFNSITADGNNVPAWYLGADYLYCLNLNDLVVGKTYALQIAAYYMDGDTAKVGTIYNVTIGADGTITASPLA